jgi:DtxR family transcriptional regulator, Mn-dependent transcriptional regulator
MHVMRKHRLAERLLVDVLGLEPEHVHEEACRWEHVISDRVEQKLIEFLGNPTTRPYGNPIDAGAAPPLATLAEATADRVTIERISEQLQGNQTVIAALDASGITPGVEVLVDRSDGDIVLRAERGSITVDDDSARLLYVSEA